MKLSKVEITGFKSFQNKTVFKLDKNLIGIVGPNGSGKSNIIDAIRWVLGEQSAKNLRGSSMKDVIFSGTEKTKRKNFAEVAITFSDEENSSEIKRRLYRNGDSEYYIDNKRAKLKDISNLYLDFGINKESYSIITQGKVDDIISSKPIDRRTIIEEASGVLKYKNRKKETQTKLEKTTENIYRLNDIFSEINGRYEVLKEQKDKTEKYLAYNKELEEKDIVLHVYNIDKQNKQLNILLEDKKIINGEKNNAEYNQKEQLEQLENLKKNRLSLDTTYLRYHEEELSLVQKRETLQAELRVIEERHNNRELQAEKISQDIRNLKERESNLLSKLAEREKSNRDLSNTLTLIIKEIDNLEKNSADNSSEIEEYIEKLKEQYYNLINEEAKLENNIEFSRKSFENADENYKLLLEDLKKLQKSQEEKNNNISELKQKMSETKHSLQAIESDILKLTEKNIKYLSEEKHLLEQIKTGETLENNTRNKKQFITSQIENLSFFNAGVKEILANKSKINGVHNSVANLLSFDAEYAVALDTALSFSQQHIVVENEQTAKYCIEHLKKNKKGRVTLLPLNNIKEKVIANDVYSLLTNEEGFINIAENLVTVDTKYRKIVSHLLGLVIIVDNLNNANRIAKKIGFRNRIITLDGQVINSGGSITGGSAINNNNSLIKNKAELTELDENIEKIQDKLEKLSDKLETVRAENKVIIEKISSLKQEKENSNLILKETELNVEHISSEILLLEKNIKQNKSKLEEYTLETQQVDNISVLEEQLLDIRNNLEQLDKKIKEETLRKENAKISENDYVEKIADLKIEKSKLTEQIKHQKELKENLGADLEETTAQLERLYTLQNTDTLSEEEEKNKVSTNKEQILECSERLSTLKNLLSDLEYEKEDILKKEQNITKKQRNLEEIIKDKTLKLEKITISQTKLEVKIEEYLESLTTKYAVTYESVRDKLTYIENIISYENDVAKLKREIFNLGNVNMNAIEEYKEIEERYEFYNTQITDLVEAKEKLEETISEIDKEVKERFLETFVQVAEHFNNIFKQLFKGGYANMSLDNPNDILNTGVVIEASPPGKKLQNLSLLSGGEKSLTAISLLFAILKVKNPPFVVLDEVEAALDEENVNRFAQFLKLYAQDNQFMVITHRRGTMESMDKLYGVTMQEKGISYILELELNDIIEKGEYN